MTSALAGIPIAKRRNLAIALGLFSALFIAVGAVAATGSTPGIVRAFCAIALGIAVLLALTGWGLLRSIKIDLAEQQLDAAIEAAIGGPIVCGCGHDHDPVELQVTDDPCGRDGTGTDCTHSCETCVLASRRRSPTRTREQR